MARVLSVSVTALVGLTGLSIDFVSFVSRNLYLSYLGVVRPVFRPILGNLSISSSPPQFESAGLTE